ncbi:MAG: M24 family metallopeptidase [Cuniculiplasma sp.]
MIFDEPIYRKRIELLREGLIGKDVDLVLIGPGANFFYFSGLDVESMERLTLLILEQDRVTIFCPKLMEEQVREESWVKNVVTYGDDENPYNKVSKLIKGNKKIQVEGTLPYFHLYRLEQEIDDRFTFDDEIFSRIRIQKDIQELKAIGDAVKRSEDSLIASISSISEGITEKAFSRILENEFFNHGLDGITFPTIVSFGKNSAMPHHSPDSTKLKKGDSIVIDYGGKYKGYSSDSTRTFFLGNPPEKMRKIFEITVSANVQTRDAVNDQTTYADMDRIARSIISDKGYGEFFIHRLGHGLGIMVHEEPYLIPQNTDPVIKNSVFTIEPGIYVENLGGVRIEDTNYFDGKKCIAFNTMKRDFEIL